MGVKTWEIEIQPILEEAMAEGDKNLPAAISIDTDALSRKALAMGEGGVAAMKEIIAVAEREREYQAQRAYDAAMLQVQSEMPQIFKDGINPDNKSRYAKLENVDRHLRPIYTAHGFTLTFNCEPLPGQPGWYMHSAIVSHSGGGVRQHSMPAPVDSKGPRGGPTKTDLQGVGSAMSYCQRRLTLEAFGAVSTGEDTDGRESPTEIETVTAEQAAELQTMADGLFVEYGKFLASFGTDMWAGIPAAKFPDAKRRLRERRQYLHDHPEAQQRLDNAIEAARRG